MRSPSAGMLAALQSASESGIVPRYFLTVNARNRTTNAIEPYYLWTGDDPITLSVRNQDGTLAARTYAGAVNLKFGSFPRSNDLNMRGIKVSMSQIASVVQNMVRGSDCRLAAVEIHSAALSTVSRLPTGPAEFEWIGLIDGAPLETPQRGEEGGLSFDVVSDALALLTLTNPRKRSHEVQQRRQNDQFNKYSGIIQDWGTFWNTKREKRKEGKVSKASTSPSSNGYIGSQR